MEPISKEKALEKLKERLADASDETLKKNLETFITYLTSTKRNGNTTMLDIWVMTNYLFPYLKGKNTQFVITHTSSIVVLPFLLVEVR